MADSQAADRTKGYQLSGYNCILILIQCGRPWPAMIDLDVLEFRFKSIEWYSEHWKVFCKAYRQQVIALDHHSVLKLLRLYLGTIEHYLLILLEKRFIESPLINCFTSITSGKLAHTF